MQMKPTPSNYKQAAKDPRWVASMEKEMNKLVENGTYVAVDDEGQPTFESLMNSNTKKTAEIRRLCASEFRLLQSVGLDGHSLERYI